MDKPFTIKIEEAEKEVVELINNSNLPAFVWKIILQNVFRQVEMTDQEEIEKYKEEVKKDDKN
jgi:hypothetical protein